MLVSSGAGGLEEPAVGEVLWWWDQRGVSGSCLENMNLLGCRFRCFPRSLLMPGPLSLRVFSRPDELAAVGAVPLRWLQSSSAEGGERGRAPAHPKTFVQRQRRQHFPCCKKKPNPLQSEGLMELRCGKETLAFSPFLRDASPSCCLV